MKHNKQLLRIEAKKIRKSLNTETISTTIVDNIKQWDKYQNSHTIMLFYPINSEINLLSLTEDKTKQFIFPIVDGNDIQPVLYTKEKGFQTGAFNIKEPIGNIANISDIELIFMPALAADLKGNRLGYGKGYYDRFLEKITKSTTTIIPTSEKLIFSHVPTEYHDKKSDYIITENRIIQINYFK